MFSFRRAVPLFGVFLLSIGIGVLGCSRSKDFSNDPKGRLTEYISRSFAVKSPGDKAELLHFLTGDVKSRLEGWSDEQFREAFIESKREFLKLLIREVKGISSSEVQITYELSYQDKGRS